MAEALGLVGSVIAVVELSAKIAKMCVQYSKEVAGARADIQRLHSQVEQLGNALQASQRLMKNAKAQSLFTSQGLSGSFHDCIAELQQVEKKLGPSTTRVAMRRLGRRALKWPFSSKEVGQILSSLERHEKTILLGLQIDQTDVLLNIQHGIEQLGLQSTEDASVSRKPHRMMPFPPNADFIPRPIIEQWIRDRYTQAGQRMALVGMGGFGKSQLAIEFAHRVYTSEASTSVFWVHGNNKATFEESYRALADVLRLPRRHEPSVNVLALVRDQLQKDDSSPWLMVVDNADDKEVFFPEKKRDNDTWQGSLSSYLPKSTNGKILVTSRSLDAAEKLVGDSQAILQIPVMEEEQALELFRNKIDGETDEAAIISLVLALDCIPLAVSQAAAYINRRSPRMTIAFYLDEFHKSSKRKDSLLRSDKGDLGRQNEVSNSVMVTWQVTFDQIEREHPRAARLLALMSQFQAQNIPESMLHSYDDDNTTMDESDQESTDIGSSSDGYSMTGYLEDDIDVLRGYSLIASSTEGLCEMHSLVQFCTRSWISEFGDPARWNHLFLKLAADHFPSGEFETWGTCQSLLPHLEPILKRRPRGQDILLQWAEISTKVSSYMFTIGEYLRAEVLAEQATQTKANILGPHHLSTLASMGNLATAIEEQGRWIEAEKLEIEIIEASKVKLGADHPSTLISIGNLASTFYSQGRWEDAEKLQIEVMETSKVKLGVHHPDTLISMGNLASTLGVQGRWEEAENLQAEVMETRKTTLGVNHPDTLISMNNLGLTFWNQGRWEDAEKLQIEVMETSTVKLGMYHPDTLMSMGNLASTLGVQGRWKEAENLLVEVTELRKVKLGADHPSTLISMGNLASMLEAQGRWEEAEKLAVQVMTTRKAKLGADHPDTLTSMANLATSWHHLGRQDEALTLMENCVNLHRKKLGHTHPDTQTLIAALQSWQLE